MGKMSSFCAFADQQIGSKSSFYVFADEQIGKFNFLGEIALNILPPFSLSRPFGKGKKHHKR